MPTPTYTALANITLGSSASSVTFSSIPATYRDLILTIAGNGIVSGNVVHFMYFNSDFTSGNYSTVRMYGTSAGAASDSATGARAGNIYANVGHTFQIQIMDYSATDKHKTYLVRNGIGPSDIVIAEAGRWANTAAITSLRVNPDSGSYNAGMTFSIYGIAS